MRRLILLLTLLAAQCGLTAGAARAAEAVPEGISVRPGYTLNIANSTLNAPRFMVVDPAGTLYVSLPGEGKVAALRDADGDGVYEQQTDFVTGYERVHGMVWHEGSLWFTQPRAIHRATDTDGDFVADKVEQVIGQPQLPDEDSGHWWRSILINKGRLYTSIGDPGNISDLPESKRMKVWSYKLDGSDERLHSSGIRNTEKLVLRPGTDEIWGMDHDSDNFGSELEQRDKASGQPITDLNPPCEMNRLDEGAFYGHPYIVGDRVPRFEYQDREDIVKLAAATVPPMWKCGAHWAPNAMTFYDAAAFPELKGDAFVAYHGSWNRSDPGGYCVTRVSFENGKPWGERKWVDFWKKNADGTGEWVGRPVDVVVDNNGSLLISDDGGNKIYRLRHIGQ